MRNIIWQSNYRQFNILKEVNVSIGARRLNYVKDVILYTGAMFFFIFGLSGPAWPESSVLITFIVMILKGIVGLFAIFCGVKIVESVYKVIVPTTRRERLSKYLEKNGFEKTEYEATALEGINTDGKKDFKIILNASLEHKFFASTLEMTKIPLSKFRVYRYASFGIVEDFTYGKFDEITVYRKQ